MINEQYLQRKKEEVELLSELADFREPFILKSYQDVIDSKLFLKEKLKAKLFQKDLSITNLSGKKSFLYHSIPISYSYSRSNFKVEHDNFFNLIHPHLILENYTSLGTFTSSGQSALSCLLNALKMWNSNLSIFSPQDDIYYETEEFIQLSQFSNGPQALFLDTSTHFNHLSFKENIKALVIDTTCFSLSDKRLGHWINIALENNTPVFLCRSHQKLDSLGIEYSSLGSLIYLKRGNKDDSLYNLCLKLLSHYGAYPQISDIYPFFSQSKFYELTEKKIERLKITNQFNDSRLHSFEHGLFNWAALGKKISKGDLAESALKFCERMSQFGIPLKFVESFGWDFSSLSILKFENYTHGKFFGNDLFKVRLAISDITDEDSKYLQKSFLNWLGGLS